jgi:hypothetical protein
MAQRHRDPLLVGQRSKRIVNHALFVARRKALDRRRRPVNLFVGRILRRIAPRQPVAVDAGVARDPVEPGLEPRAVRSPTCGPFPQAEKGFLRRVLGGGAVLKEGPAEREDARRMARNEG